MLKSLILIGFSVIVGFFSFILPYSFILSIALLVTGLIGTAFAYYMPALTKQGAEAKWKALGFKEYLRVAERFRIGAETIETFSKFLPFAIVFGVEKQWAYRFSDFSFKDQSWYVASSSNFSASFASFTSSMSSSFSAPSGAGGAGSAGGGGGGGGGGAG